MCNLVFVLRLLLFWNANEMFWEKQFSHISFFISFKLSSLRKNVDVVIQHFCSNNSHSISNIIIISQILATYTYCSLLIELNKSHYYVRLQTAGIWAPCWSWLLVTSYWLLIHLLVTDSVYWLLIHLLVTDSFTGYWIVYWLLIHLLVTDSFTGYWFGLLVTDSVYWLLIRFTSYCLLIRITGYWFGLLVTGSFTGYWFVYWLLIRFTSYWFGLLVTGSNYWLLIRVTSYWFIYWLLIRSTAHWLGLLFTGYWFDLMITDSGYYLLVTDSIYCYWFG